MYILITANNCPKCEAMKQKLKEKKMEYMEMHIEHFTSGIMTKLRTSGIFKTEMPILVKEIGDEWEEVKCG